MKQIKLSITETYVAHWSWWQGVREILQNAVDTKNYDVEFGEGNIKVVSRGGKIPVSALLLGKTGKTNDKGSIGKFGEGMKLGFLVLKRLGGGILVNNEGDLWCPEMVYDEQFEEKVLAVNIEENCLGSEPETVEININNIPAQAMEEIKSKFAPAQELEVVIENSRGKAYKKENHHSPCRLFINGIFVTSVPGHWKFDYDFIPEAFVLDRDRDSASTFEVKYESSLLLAKCADILLLAQLATEDYDDLKDFSGRFEDYRTGKSKTYYHDDEVEEYTLEERAVELFKERHGYNAFPISQTWDEKKKRLVTDGAIKKGYSPIVVNQALYRMVEDSFRVGKEVSAMLNFDILQYLESFLEKHRRNMRAKPRKELERKIEMLKIAKGE